jgi:ATP-binding cassette subfamily C protein CydD
MMKHPLAAELRPHKQTIAGLTALSALNALCIGAFTWLLAKTCANAFFAGLNLTKAAPFLLVLLLLAALRLYSERQLQLRAKKLSLAVQTVLRSRLTGKLLQDGPQQTGYQDSGDFVLLMTSGVDHTDPYFSQFLPQMVTVAVLPLLLLLSVLPLDPLTGAVFALTAPLLPFFLYLIGRLCAAASARQWQTLSAMGRSFTELLQGLPTLKIFNRSQQQLALVEQLGHDFREATLKVLRIAFLSAFALELTATLSIAVVAVLVGLRLLNGTLSFETGLFALLLAPEFYRPLRHSGTAFHQAMTALAAADKIYARLTASAISVKPAYQGKNSPSIRMENISFSYGRQHKNAVDKISLTLPPGKITAIVGRSGAGKSTIFQLILQFIHPEQGRILIDDNNAATFDADTWRQQISYVPQMPHIFSASVAENISLGQPAEAAAIITAAKAARLHDFIISLPQGYDTHLGSGYQLSGGQAQRLAIARAFLQDRPVLLLDEPTACLDEETGQQILEAIEKLARGKTVLISAHRLAVVKTSALILVLDGGKIIESGSHKELVAKKGHYFELLQSGVVRL